ncbi:hypothetical protein ACWEIJ_42630 [Lentzea sp. NPDC004789]
MHRTQARRHFDSPVRRAAATPGPRAVPEIWAKSIRSLELELKLIFSTTPARSVSFARTGVILAISAAFALGTGDFFGGIAAQRASVWTVVPWSNLAGAVVAVAGRGGPVRGVATVCPAGGSIRVGQHYTHDSGAAVTGARGVQLNGLRPGPSRLNT